MEFPFNEVWQRICKATSWTKQGQLAEYLDIAPQSVSGAKARGSFPIEWALKVANGFDASTDYLLFGMVRDKLNTPGVSADQESDTVATTAIPETAAPSRPGMVPRRVEPDPDIFYYVPFVKAQLSAEDTPLMLLEKVLGYYSFRKEWLQRVSSGLDNVVLTMIRGDSMRPTLLDRDFVLIDVGVTSIIDNMMYAIRIDDTVLVKRLQYRPGNIIKVISDNKEEYDSYEIEKRIW